MDPVVREWQPEADAADLSALAPAFLDIWNAPANLRFLSFTQRPFEEAQVRGWLRAHRAAGVRYFAEMGEDGRVLGIAALRADPLQGAEAMALGVRPDAQRRGTGRRLAEAMMRAARADGYRALDAAVFADNAPMLRLLLALGFVPVRMEHRRRADGADLVLLRGPL